MNLNYFDQIIDKIINNNNSPKSESIYIYFFKKKIIHIYIYIMCIYLKISFNKKIINSKTEKT